MSKKSLSFICIVAFVFCLMGSVAYADTTIVGLTAAQGNFSEEGEYISNKAPLG